MRIYWTAVVVSLYMFRPPCGHLQGGVFTKDKLQRTTLREQRRVRVFENRVLRRIFGPKRDEATGDVGRPHNEVIKSRRMRWKGHVACMGDMRGAYRFFVRRPEGKRPLGRSRCRW